MPSSEIVPRREPPGGPEPQAIALSRAVVAGLCAAGEGGSAARALGSAPTASARCSLGVTLSAHGATNAARSRAPGRLMSLSGRSCGPFHTHTNFGDGPATHRRANIAGSLRTGWGRRKGASSRPRAARVGVGTGPAAVRARPGLRPLLLLDALLGALLLHVGAPRVQERPSNSPKRLFAGRICT